MSVPFDQRALNFHPIILTMESRQQQQNLLYWLIKEIVTAKLWQTIFKVIPGTSALPQRKRGLKATKLIESRRCGGS